MSREWVSRVVERSRCRPRQGQGYLGRGTLKVVTVTGGRGLKVGGSAQCQCQAWHAALHACAGNCLLSAKRRSALRSREMPSVNTPRASHLPLRQFVVFIQYMCVRMHMRMYIPPLKTGIPSHTSDLG